MTRVDHRGGLSRTTARSGRRGSRTPVAPEAGPGTSAPSGWGTPAAYAALALAVLIASLPATRHDFINFDDPQYVFDNPQVRAGLTWRGVAWALTTTHAGNWHPVTWWSHMLDVELFGLRPGAHHATSIVLHLANTILLFAALRRMTAR